MGVDLESEAAAAVVVDAAMLADGYAELRRLARRLLGNAGSRLLLQPTELAHETAIRLLQLDRMEFSSREHMLATAARLARQTLIDELRRAGRAKRQIPAAMTLLPDTPAPVRLEALHEAIEALAGVSPDHARLVELRFMLGMTVEEVAETCDLSPRTVKRRWQATRAWLQDWLDRHDVGA